MINLLTTIFVIVLVITIIAVSTLSRNGVSSKTKKSSLIEQISPFQTAKMEVLDRLDQIKDDVEEKLLVPGTEETKLVNQIQELDNEMKNFFDTPVKDVYYLKAILDPLKDKLSQSEINSIFNNIETLESKILDLLNQHVKPFKSISLDLIKEFNDINNDKDSVLSKIKSFEKEIKKHFESPVKDITALKNLLDPLKNRFSVAQIQNVFTTINNIEMKMRTLFTQYLAQVQVFCSGLKEEVSRDSTKIMQKLESLQAYEPTHLGIKINNLEDNLKIYFQAPIQAVAELKSILVPISGNLTPAQLDRAFSTIDEIKSIMEKGFVEPLHSIVTMLKQIKSTNFNQDIKNLETVFKTILQNVLSDLETLKSKVNQNNNNADQIVTSLTALENSFKEFMQPPIVAIFDIQSKLSHNSDIEDKLTDLKDNFKMSKDDISVLKNIFEPIKDYLTPANLDNVVLRIKEVQDSLVGRIKTIISQNDLVSLITAKEQRINDIFTELSKNTNLLHNIEFISMVVDKLGKSNDPNDIAKVFFTVQNLCNLYDDFEAETKKDLKLSPRRKITLQNILKNIQDKQKSLLREVVGTDFISFKDSIDKLYLKTLSSNDFIELQNAFLNNSDGKFSDLVNSITKLEQSTQKFIENTNNISKDIDSKMIKAKESLSDKIDSIKSDITVVTRTEAEKVLNKINSKL